MNDIIAALVIIFIAYVLFKIFSPNQVPDYKFCSGASCWSTKRKPYVAQEDPDVKTPDIDLCTNPVDKTVSSQQEDPVPMHEVFTSPKDFKDIKDKLKHITEDNLSLNYSVKYSKN